MKNALATFIAGMALAVIAGCTIPYISERPGQGMKIFYADIFTIREELKDRDFYGQVCTGGPLYCSHYPEGFIDVTALEYWCEMGWENVPPEKNDCLNYKLPVREISNLDRYGILLMPSIRERGFDGKPKLNFE